MTEQCKHQWEINPDNSFRRVRCAIKNCFEQMGDAEIESRLNGHTALLEALEAFVWAQDASDRNTGPRWNIQFLDEANTKAIEAIRKAKEKW